MVCTTTPTGRVGGAPAPPPPGPGALAGVIRALAESEPDGVAGLSEAFTRLGERLPRRSVAFVISDLMEEPAAWGPSLGALASRGVDCRIVHVHDPGEWQLSYGKAVVLFSPENGLETPIEPADARSAMAEVVAEYLNEVRDILGRNRCRHHLAPIDAPLDGLLAAVLDGRS